MECGIQLTINPKNDIEKRQFGREITNLNRLIPVTEIRAEPPKTTRKRPISNPNLSADEPNKKKSKS